MASQKMPKRLRQIRWNHNIVKDGKNWRIDNQKLDRAKLTRQNVRKTR